MKKLNHKLWLVLAGVSLFVGFWVLISEGPAGSKYYVYFIFTLLSLGLFWLDGNRDTQKAKKGKTKR